MSEKLPQSLLEFNHIINESYLSVYKQQDETKLHGYNAMLSFQDMDIYVLHEVADLKSDVENVPKNELYEASKKTVNELMRRHIKLQKAYVKKQESKKKKNKRKTDELHSELSRKAYFIGLATLIVTYKDQSYSIDHQFGSTYFQEQCVLDFDPQDNILQLFGTKSFITIMKLLASPSDTLAYLEYHRDTLVKQCAYPYETVLANTFLRSSEFFDRAMSVEKKLIDINVLDMHDNRLLKAIEPDNIKQKDDLVAQMREYSELWVKLLQRTTARQGKSNNPLSKKIIHQMVGESLYTRMKIIEDVFGYGQMTVHQRQEGYILYQHSYSRFGRQFMIVMYASNPQSWLSRDAVRQENLNLLINLNSQLQNPVMEDLFLLGFDMSNMRESGDVDVQMDVYHLTATKMTELEQYLHGQLVKLKANVQPDLKPRAT